MKPHDDETERYLEEFRPRRIRGLDLRRGMKKYSDRFWMPTAPPSE
jgi:hypothetical protein